METAGEMKVIGLKNADISSVAKSHRGSSWRVNFATFIGTTLEWYDFFIYGAVAALVFNKVFFPSFEPLVGTLLAFATFSVGFVARPLGAIIFGHFGDTRGRKNILTATLLTMGITTILIGLLPSYETIGVLAPILLVSLRFIQGIGIGGEWGGAIIMASEHGSDNRRGLHTSWTQIGSSAGNLLSFGVLAITTAALPADTFAGWGWRIPFLLSVTLLFAGIWVRSSLKETPDFVELKSTGKVTRSPLLELIQRYPAHLIIACLIRVGSDVVFYTTSLFVLSYTTSQLGLARQISIQAILIGSALLLLLIPLFASISDKMGRRTVFFVGAVSCAAWMFFFFFELIKSRDPLWISVAVIVAMVLWSIMYAPIGAFIAELFPANVRYSGTSLGIQLTGIFGGGVAPLIETYLLQQSSGTGSVSIYVAATIGISALAMLASLKIPKPND